MEAGKVEGRQTTNGATASEGKKSGAAFQGLFKGWVSPAPLEKWNGDADVFLSLGCSYISAWA